jgi:hypothetical protein
MMEMEEDVSRGIQCQVPDGIGLFQYLEDVTRKKHKLAVFRWHVEMR